MKSIALVDCRMSTKCRDRLTEYGFFVIPLPPFHRLEDSVASHPDMLLHHFGDILITHEDYRTSASKEFSLIHFLRPELKLLLTDDDLNEKYPHDIIFNAATVGKNIFGRLDFLSPPLLKTANELGYSLHNIKQGYSACSCCTIDENSIITSDSSLAKAARAVGLSVLSISEGHITLPYHDYGFIGGACGLFENRLYFIGNIDLHPNSEEIRAFATERGVEVVSLSNEPLTDCGKIIFI